MSEEYDDNEYDDDQYDYDHPSLNPYQWYYKFDVSADSPISKWLNNLKDILDNLPSLPSHQINDLSDWPSLPVISWNPNAGSNHSLQYLGSNYQGTPIWKQKYFVFDPINTEYKLHLQQHATHFIQQPIYYKGMFDILN